MALFLSSLIDNSAATSKVSLTPEAHVTVYRMWMAVLLRDRLTIAEQLHLSSCHTCKRAFDVAQGTDVIRDDRSAPISSPLPAKDGDTPRAA